MNLESQDKSIDPATGKLAVFEDKQIRRVFHNGEWFFSIIDIVAVLTGSPNPRRYWSDLKIQVSEKEGFSQLYGKRVQLKFKSSNGKKYRTDSANTASGEEALRQERGGCWRYPDKFAFRSSQRSFVVSKAVNDFRGFRLVLPVQPGS